MQDYQPANQTNNPTTNPTTSPTDQPVAQPPTKRSSMLSLAKRHHTLSICLILLAAIAIFAIAISTNSNKTKTAAVANTASVSVNATSFFPKTIQVNTGQAVTWTNYDNSPHWVASDPFPKNDKLSSLNSEAMQTNDSYTYTFDKAGTYSYHDQLHPYDVKGTVIVK